MKQPNLSDMRIDNVGTRKIRTAAKKKSVKITINIDRDSLSLLRAMADETGVPYQRLLNTLLRESLKGKEMVQSRIERLEHELRKVKRKLAA